MTDPKGKPDSPPGQDKVPPGQLKPMPPGQAKKQEEAVPIDQATGKPFKKGEVPPGANEPVGGEFTGATKERMDRDAEDAEAAEKEANDRAEKERKRLEDAAAKAAKENAAPAKKDA